MRFYGHLLCAAAMLLAAEARGEDSEDLLRTPVANAATARALAGSLQVYPQKITKTVNGVTFNSDYDNGSLQDVTAGSGTDTFDCTRYSDIGTLGSATYWFRFTMTGVAGRTIRLNINHTQSPRPAVRFADEPWRRTTAAEVPSTSQIVIECPPGEDWLEVAFFEPLGLQETYTRVQEIVDASPHAMIEDIGDSYLGTPLKMVTVTDSAFDDSGKHRVWMHSRAHPGEVTSTHSLIGFLEQATEESDVGRRLRQNVIFNIVPLENVDGVWAGHTRWDVQGENQEGDWCTPVLPEVQAIKQRVDGFMAGPNPIEVALNMHSTQGNFSDSFFFKHLAPSVTPQFEIIQQRYIDALDNATPLFRNASPGSSQLSHCDSTTRIKYIESYFWEHWGESVMAMTHEGHYFYRVTDGQPITGDDYRAIGGAMAEALVEYFDLPELVSSSEGWVLF